jgi:dienelactone hydrolase
MIDYSATEHPQSLSQWEDYKIEARAGLWRLLGDMPPMLTPQPKVIETKSHEGYRVEKLEFDNGASATVYAYLLLPDGDDTPKPAILYNHLHGGKYYLGKDELFDASISGSQVGVELVKAGYVVLAIDAYGFGERRAQLPVGMPAEEREDGRALEMALYKHFIWQGYTLWGMMLRDDLLALNYLLSRSDVDSARIGATGMSLGASRTTWLGALDERIKVIVPVAQMTRYQDFAAQANYNLHGIYYYLPGVLKSGIDMEVIASLTAPRVQHVLIGNADPLSPIEGVNKVVDFARHIYELYEASDKFEAKIYDGVAHKYTPEMLTAMLACFQQHL